MANENNFLEMLRKAIKDEGLNASDLNKVIKSLKTSGELKSRRGKTPQDTPEKVAIREYILQGDILSKVSKGCAPLKVGDKPTNSLMITLDKAWSVNFVRKVVRPKVSKEKKEAAKAEKAAEVAAKVVGDTAFADPAIA
jgi:hypothetical protein